MGESEAWKQVSSSLIPLRYFCVLFTPIYKAKQLNIRSDVQMCRCSLEGVSMLVFNKISGYKTQTLMWNTEEWKMKNSCLISKQNVVISPTKS